MNLDIRLPIGGMFAIVGLVLLVFGVVTAGQSGLYAPRMMLGVNINILWGLVMLLFGGFMLLLGRRSAAAPPPQNDATPPDARPRGH